MQRLTVRKRNTSRKLAGINNRLETLRELIRYAREPIRFRKRRPRSINALPQTRDHVHLPAENGS